MGRCCRKVPSRGKVPEIRVFVLFFVSFFTSLLMLMTGATISHSNGPDFPHWFNWTVVSCFPFMAFWGLTVNEFFGGEGFRQGS